MDGARPLFADLAFSRRRWTFRDFADVELITVPEIVQRRGIWSSRPVYIFVNVVRAPHPRGGVRIRRMGG